MCTFATMEYGAQCVKTHLMWLMLLWSAGNLGTVQLVSHRGNFGWIGPGKVGVTSSHISQVLSKVKWLKCLLEFEILRKLTNA